ncbi:transposable element Tc3 transposase [Trichonephila clavipes]|nr:transposable element Tc3 transposase [Trichonephila clavipes]
MTGHIYRDVILEHHVRLFRGAMGGEFLLMDVNARPHRANIVDECLQSEDITRMDWTAYSPDLNPIEHVWDMLGRRIVAHQPPPTCLPELGKTLLDEWCNIPQDQNDNLTLSMPRRCKSISQSRQETNRGRLSCQNSRRSTCTKNQGYKQQPISQSRRETNRTRLSCQNSRRSTCTKNQGYKQQSISQSRQETKRGRLSCQNSRRSTCTKNQGYKQQSISQSRQETKRGRLRCQNSRRSRGAQQQQRQEMRGKSTSRRTASLEVLVGDINNKKH